MTTHLTKIWLDLNRHKLVEQAIPETEIYKREWVGLTDGERADLRYEADIGPDAIITATEAKLREKNA